MARRSHAGRASLRGISLGRVSPALRASLLRREHTIGHCNSHPWLGLILRHVGLVLLYSLQLALLAIDTHQVLHIIAHLHSLLMLKREILNWIKLLFNGSLDSGFWKG